ncbi:hypothetical protein O4G98_04620 [Zoogloeaceae bacterium G21618-S1]|nr:hypothetical protein [Zoogloeaceae bacterium G21618-S1]
MKSSYLIFKSSGIYNSGVLERVFYQLYFWAFNKPLGENFGEKLWRMLPILQGRDLFVRENIFLIMFYVATFLSAGHFRLCGARIARLNRLKREAEDDIIRDAYRGVEPARPESVMEPQRVDYLWTRKEKVIDRYLAPL